jgi:hypothetical protein
MAGKEVERGRRHAAKRALTSARWNELPERPFLPSLQPRPEPNLPSHSEDEPPVFLDCASARGCAAQWSDDQVTT